MSQGLRPTKIFMTIRPQLLILEILLTAAKETNQPIRRENTLPMSDELTNNKIIINQQNTGPNNQYGH